jgi:hypothetical protein
MNANEITAKQTAEMLDLKQMQEQEIEEMTKRHDREYVGNPSSTYFAEKRLRQRNVLLARHKIESTRLYELHEKEYNEWHKLKTIIREADQLSFESEPKKQIKPQKEEAPEPETRVQKLKKLWQKMRGKDLEKEM